ncbi:MAG: hypothetical protein GY937_05870 [bacterium]|nr:hypothetical protein [bacterium]
MTPPEKPGTGAILQAIKRLYETGAFIPRDHFHERIDERSVPHSVFPSVFESAEVVRGPDWDFEFGNWKVTIEGATPDEESVRLGLAVDIEEDRLFLLTVFYVD